MDLLLEEVVRLYDGEIVMKQEALRNSLLKKYLQASYNVGKSRTGPAGSGIRALAPGAPGLPF